MRSTIFLACLSITLLLGAGCTNTSKTTLSTSVDIPHIRLEQPMNYTTTASSSVDIIGSSNMSAVWVNGLKTPVIKGTFVSSVFLIPGTNRISLETGNGMTSTTIDLLVTRTNVTSSTSSHL